MIDGKKMNNLAQQYEEQGFVIIQGKDDEFSALRSDFLRVFNEISFLNGTGEIKNDQDIISLYNVGGLLVYSNDVVILIQDF